jgi:GTPase SAR1 family protein
LILVGSKCDLEGDREVAKSEGQELGTKWQCPFFETSAKTRINVDEVFMELVRIVKISKKKDGGTVEEGGNNSHCCVLL